MQKGHLIPKHIILQDEHSVIPSLKIRVLFFHYIHMCAAQYSCFSRELLRFGVAYSVYQGLFDGLSLFILQEDFIADKDINTDLT